MNVRGGILDGKSCGRTSSCTGSLQLVSEESFTQNLANGCGGRFNLVVGSISFNCTMDEIFKNLVDHSTS